MGEARAPAFMIIIMQHYAVKLLPARQQIAAKRGMRANKASRRLAAVKFLRSRCRLLWLLAVVILMLLYRAEHGDVSRRDFY